MNSTLAGGLMMSKMIVNTGQETLTLFPALNAWMGTKFEDLQSGE